MVQYVVAFGAWSNLRSFEDRIAEMKKIMKHTTLLPVGYAAGKN